jgi:hypothetical protein
MAQASFALLHASASELSDPIVDRLCPDFSDDPFGDRRRTENSSGLFLDDMDAGQFSDPFRVLK